MLKNASYLHLRHTKNKTLETSGLPTKKTEKSNTDFPRLHMKQAIQEGFILDVLSDYTPVKSYFNL